jgi:hypothetical protein
MGRIDRIKHDIDVIERVLSRVRDEGSDDSRSMDVQLTVVGLARETEEYPRHEPRTHEGSTPRR